MFSLSAPNSWKAFPRLGISVRDILPRLGIISLAAAVFPQDA
ncbi:MAG: hypothetical protein WCD70_03115 [Alphaproteobacteria bacterium]